MKVDKKLISRLENLSLLSFTEEERTRLIPEFEKLIGMLHKLESVDTQAFEPLLNVNNHVQRLRDDIVDDELETKVALKNAQHATNEFFTVPKVIKQK